MVVMYTLTFYNLLSWEVIVRSLAELGTQTSDVRQGETTHK